MRVPQKWTAGTEPCADDFNEYISDVIEFLLDPPHARVRQTSVQAVTYLSFQTITFDTCDKDNDGMWDAGAPTLLTIQTPGWYEVNYGGSIANPGTFKRFITGLIYNGSLDHANGGTRGRSDVVCGSAAGSIVCPGRLYTMFLNVGDTIGLVIQQESAAGQNTVVTSEATQPFLTLHWVSL